MATQNELMHLLVGQIPFRDEATARQAHADVDEAFPLPAVEDVTPVASDDL